MVINNYDNNKQIISKVIVAIVKVIRSYLNFGLFKLC